jgi:hypothetical protein
VSHCGSLNADDHRVDMLPSTAFAAWYPVPWIDDAVAVPVNNRSERTRTGAPSSMPLPAQPGAASMASSRIAAPRGR